VKGASGDGQENRLRARLPGASEGQRNAPPDRTDHVKVHYSGWTTDGKMFDSSVTRGEPASFGLDGVIKGWTEGVQLMVEGRKDAVLDPAEAGLWKQPETGGAFLDRSPSTSSLPAIHGFTNRSATIDGQCQSFAGDDGCVVPLFFHHTLALTPMRSSASSSRSGSWWKSATVEASACLDNSSTSLTASAPSHAFGACRPRCTARPWMSSPLA